MELLFADARLQAIAESRVKCDAHFGPADGSILRQRLCELMAADNLGIAATLPTLQVRPMDGRDAAFAIALRNGWRLVVEVVGPVPRVAECAAVDLQSVEAVRVLTIEESDEP